MNKGNNSRKERGLGKHDAPLSVQYNRGVVDFKKGRTVNPFSDDTMLYREWERGFNAAYFENLKEVKRNEQLTKRGRAISEGEVQHV